MLAESYLHSLDPYVIQFTEGGFGIRWYGLAYVAGFLIAWGLIKWLARTGRSIIPVHAVGDFMIYAIVGVLVGGRLGYVLFYDPSLVVSFSSDPPWWGLLAINRGGMASHGGMIGAILAMLIFMRKNRLTPIMHAPDLVAFVAAPGLFLGRLANFINAELWGHPVPDQTNPPWWSIKYPDEVMLGTVDLSPVEGMIPGDETFLINVREALVRGEPTIIDSVVPQLTAFYPSQIFQALSDGPILFLAMIIIWWVPRKAGVLTGSFLVIYGILRIITELFRQPDEGVSLLLGLSRGQTLSVGMIVVGTVIVGICGSIQSRRLGGLGTPPPRDAA